MSVAYLTWPDGAVEGRDYQPAFGWLRWAGGGCGRGAAGILIGLGCALAGLRRRR